MSDTTLPTPPAATRSIRVRFEKGVFVPAEPVDLPEGTMTEVQVPAGPDVRGLMPGHPLYGLGVISEEKAKAMLEAIDEAFGHVDPEDWDDRPR